MKYFLFFAVGCLIAFATFSLYQKNQSPSEINKGISEFERDLDTLVVLHASEIILDSLVSRPESISYKNNHIYVADFGSMQVLKFDTNWGLVSKIGTGKGRGPEQLLSISDFYVEGTSIWIVDTQQYSIKKFSTSGELLDIYNIKRFPLRVVANDSMMTSLCMGGDDLFVTVNTNYEGNEEYFGKFLDNQIRHSISLDGNLSKVRDSLFAYVPRYFSKIYFYEFMTGEEEYVLSLPDGQKFPASKSEETNEGHRISAPQNVRFNNTGVYTRGDVLLVSVYDKGVKEGGEYVEIPKIYFDALDLKKRQYTKSFFFPGWFKEFALNGKKLYVITTVGKIFELQLNINMVDQH